MPILAPLTVNEFTVKDSFSFAEEITKKDSQLYMASLDVDSLFTNIPLQKTIDICVEKLFENCELVHNLNKCDLRNLLTLATNQSYFTFDGILYQQVDGVAMGSPLGPSLANAFLSYHEKKWLEDCPASFKPVYYRRYVDDVFVLFSSPEHLPLFQEYLNNKHLNISFTSECESNNSLPFLDVNAIRDGSTFSTSVYRKPTFSGVYTNFASFMPKEYKLGLIYTLIFRIFTIVSDFSRFHVEVQKLRTILLKNGYPTCLIDSCVKSFLNKVYKVKEIVLTAERKEIFIVLPYLGNTSLQLRTRLEKAFRKYLPCCKFRVIFRTSIRLSNFFKFKDRPSKELRSLVVYKFLCGSCNATYYGETSRHLKVRACEHMGITPLLEKISKSKKTTAVKEHLRCCPHRASLDDFSIMTSAQSKFLLEIKESLLIHRDTPTLNKNVTSVPLYLFDKYN